MKQLLLTLGAGIIVLFFTPAYAQTRELTGQVTAEDGSVLPGVNISVKNTTKGSITDNNGRYTINVEPGNILVFSFIGFKSKDAQVGNQTRLDVVLTSDETQLQEIVVTSLGIAREKKALGYAVQEIKADKLTLARDPNIGNALAGKIAGVQVLGQSAAKFGTPTIRIRGINSLAGSDPLYVVDGTPTDISMVNMDDVESLTVLKGPSATALYGNRASAGVVVVTTKRGKSGETSLNFNHSMTMDQVSLLPRYQNEYGGGYSQEWETFKFNPQIHPAAWASYEGQRILDYSADESWGPKLDGQMHRSAFSWQPGEGFGKETPFVAHPNNVRDFFEKPVSYNSNIAFSKAGDSYSSRISYTHIVNNGIVPNSRQLRDYISAKTSISFAKKLTAELNVSYTGTKTDNAPADRYGSSGGTGTGTALFNTNNATLNGYNQTTGSFNQWFQRQLDIKDLQNYKNPDGTFRSWNIGSPTDARPKYWDSPYTQAYENTNVNRQQRIFGDAGLTYQVTDYLKITGKVRRDYGTFFMDGRVASGTLNAGGLGAYAYLSGAISENNYETIASFGKDIQKISILINAGGNIRYNRTEGTLQATVGGLTTPGYYNIAASKDRPLTANYLFEKQVNSVFANASVGYGDFLFIEGSIRNDWSSTLPPSSNSYLYPSVSTSLVFSEFIPANRVLSFGKLRAGYAQVGTDLGAYQTALSYNAGSVYGSNPTMTLPGILPNSSLKPGMSSSYEGGIDLRFFSNRLGLEFTAYNNDNSNQIIPLAVASTSGYNNAVVNAGMITTKGLELHISAQPVKTGEFLWELDINADRNESKVVKLTEQSDNYRLDGPQWRALTLNAREGKDWGMLEGVGIKRDEQGNKVVYSPTPENIKAGKAGLYVKENNVNLGNVLPKFKGGLINAFEYKGLTLQLSTDFVVGGKFFSVTRMFNAGSGLAEETAGNNELGKPKRDDPANGGGVLLDAVTEDGQPNTYRVDTQNLYENWLFALNEQWIYDKTYVKLREVSLGYKIPKRLLGRHLKSASVSLIGRNLLLMYSAIGGGIDISETETLWYEGGQLPPVRSVGATLRVGF
ncbi:SusC/RagA family TonB-linked outer membrane protein [Dyadobacter fermentans]|uniref:TonB-dependent receptor plug n=1 Tax=Dyadobacter fermentans (strain ATCC 700827 / DSM 18053 / CIP 107007 / KCTC 52180 / NS114) TaxID=471854 RepID=C6W3F9_DYAFD|nr:SusC/RagA family TonB-linked outer membrane protein [Dyadobacter fermentans]ACT93936.1 TonB-dependent receptor plug [Dyadobacter fermentans DSM 18053]